MITLVCVSDGVDWCWCRFCRRFACGPMGVCCCCRIWLSELQWCRLLKWPASNRNCWSEWTVSSIVLKNTKKSTLALSDANRGSLTEKNRTKNASCGPTILLLYELSFCNSWGIWRTFSDDVILSFCLGVHDVSYDEIISFFLGVYDVFRNDEIVFLWVFTTFRRNSLSWQGVLYDVS